jgi:hypothetical protein
MPTDIVHVGALDGRGSVRALEAVVSTPLFPGLERAA